MSSKQKKHIVLYGLSANPPTGDGGHRGIVKYLVENNSNEEYHFDELWILPVFKHASTAKSNLLEYEKRVEMCKLNFLDLNKKKNKNNQNNQNNHKCVIKISEYEKDIKTKLLNIIKNKKNNNKKNNNKETLGTINIQQTKNALMNEFIGTVDVLVELKKEHPDTEFSFILGHDTYFDLLNGEWKKGPEIFDNVKHLYVITRLGTKRKIAKQGKTKINNNNGKLPENYQKKVVELTIPGLTDISSSKIRENLQKLKRIINNKNNENDKKYYNILEIISVLQEGLYNPVLKYILSNKDVFDYYSTPPT